MPVGASSCAGQRLPQPTHEGSNATSSVVESPERECLGLLVWFHLLLSRIRKMKSSSLFLALVLLAAPSPVSAQCVPDTIGVPVSLANGVSVSPFGSAQGESFWAYDTLVKSITIWRPANFPVALGLNLFIGKAFITQPLLFDCGVVRMYDSDPPGQPVPMTWTFDPPLSLPYMGLFVLWLQVEGCNAYDYPILYHTGSDEYPIGGCVYTIRSLVDCVHVPNINGGCPQDVDMCFRVVFCHDAVTATRRSTWGGLKVLYR